MVDKDGLGSFGLGVKVGDELGDDVVGKKSGQMLGCNYYLLYKNTDST